MLFAVTLLYYKTQHQDLTFVEFKGAAKIRFFHRKQKLQPIKKNIQRMLYVLKFYLQGPRGSEGIRFVSKTSGVFQSKTMKKSQNI